MIQPTRRAFIRTAALLFAAPVIVRASSLMPVRALPEPNERGLIWPRDYHEINFQLIAFGSVIYKLDPAFALAARHG